MTIYEAFERHREDKIVFANLSAKTEESYIYTRKSLLNFIGEDMPLSSLTFSMIRDWKISLEKRGLVSGTIRGYIVNLRVVLDYMNKLNIPCLDPETIPIPKRIDKVPSVLTPDEVAHLILVVSATPNSSKLTKARNMAIIALMYSSAIRASELCSLNREDVQEEVFVVYGKGGKSRPCMIDERARKLLANYLALREDCNEALFLDNQSGNMRLKVGTLQAQFRRISKRTGFTKPVHPHTLRHSFATDLMKKGCHIYPLSRMMGHSSIATTQTYFRLYDPELLEVYKKYHTI